MKAQIKTMVRECDTCQRNEYEAISPPGLLEPLPVPENVWEDLTMDFVEKLPLSQSKDTVMVVVNRYSKFVHFISLKHPFTAIKVAQLLFDEVFKLWVA